MYGGVWGRLWKKHKCYGGFKRFFLGVQSLWLKIIMVRCFGFFLAVIAAQCMDTTKVWWFVGCTYLEPFHCDGKDCF